MSKYGNKRTNGFQSKREAKRAAELDLMQKAGMIDNLQTQVKFVLIPKQIGERKCEYIADFTYNNKDKQLIVEDCKGYRTKDYIIKRKLMLWVHGIKILET